MKIIVSVDIGTTKIAVIAYDAYKQNILLILTEQNSSTLKNSNKLIHEQSPLLIFNIVSEMLKNLMSHKDILINHIEAITFSGQMHGLLLVDEKLQPLTNLITWCDQRTASFCDSINQNKWPIERTGCFLHAGYGGATLAWLEQNSMISDNAIALPIANFIAAKLGGNICIDITHAASWGIVNLHEKTWDKEILNYLKISSKVLPPICPSFGVIGHFSLDKRIKICTPIGDNQSSFLGTCYGDKDTILLNLGTGGQISFLSDKITTISNLETRPMPCGNYLLVGSSLCGGRSYAILKDFFKETIREFTNKTLEDKLIYKVMDKIAMQADSSLVVNSYFAATRLEKNRSGQINNITVNNFTPANMTLGFLQGMISELSNILSKETKSKYTKIMASGNAVRKCPLMQQLISQEFTMPCNVADVLEEAAIGVAYLATTINLDTEKNNA